MGTKKNVKKYTSLSAGRPPHSYQPSGNLSSKATRTTIRAYHTLTKRLARARASHRNAEVTEIEAQLASLGGLAAYQAASAQGQAQERGGDTSVELMRWLTASPRNPHASSSASSTLPHGVVGATDQTEKNGNRNENDPNPAGPSNPSASSETPFAVPTPPLKLLEIGALSTTNACARGDLFAAGIERIDLRARTPGILRQDFMQRPLPRDAVADTFDVLSLSLVLNFVPEARARGEMLRRTTAFLRGAVPFPARHPHQEEQQQQQQQQPESDRKVPERQGKEAKGEEVIPAAGLLFLVLPAPCVVNSRYFDDARLTRVMASLGYVRRRRKQTAKLVYYLWQQGGPPTGEEVRKSLIRDGPGMNNFCVELRN